ncbi:MAG TPA: hypothetical protein QF621_03615 [Candidatus Thalassarchaeaceae archaeon]|nr:hypothetical protein [Candidatus Thalassarchaeaceae archaeon]
MEKLIEPMVKAVSGFMPGMKTYFMMFLALGMTFCQIRGYHVFGTDTWQAVGIVGGITWKMGMDRKG